MFKTLFSNGKATKKERRRNQALVEFKKELDGAKNQAGNEPTALKEKDDKIMDELRQVQESNATLADENDKAAKELESKSAELKLATLRSSLLKSKVDELEMKLGANGENAENSHDSGAKCKNDSSTDGVGQTHMEQLQFAELVKMDKKIKDAKDSHILLAEQNGKTMTELMETKVTLAKTGAENVAVNEKVASLTKQLEESKQNAQELKENLKVAEDKLLVECHKNDEFFKIVCSSGPLRNQFVRKLEKYAWAKYHSEKYEEAIKLCAEGIVLEVSGRRSAKQVGNFWYLTAVCYGNLKRYEKALESIEKAITFQQKDATYYYARAFYYNKIGNSEKAINDLKQARKLAPNFKKAKELLAEIEQK